MKQLFTSESVTEGHPDKVCDQISDAILDEALKQDSNSRVACETLITQGIVYVAGEITTKSYIDVSQVVNKVLDKIGYNPSEFGIISSIHKQSPDIALGVDTGGAGDQGMMFGYATDETENYMPIAIDLANKLTMRLSEVRKSGELEYLKPDGKSQVTILGDKIDTIVLSAHHDKKIDIKNLRKDLLDSVIYYIIDSLEYQYDFEKLKIHINPTGRFEVGGPTADTGLTGRKIIVDTYGGYARHGGGAFSGKDPSKVDRSAAYMARHIAKSIVGSKLAKKCEIQLAYVIGVKEPVGIYVDTFRTGKEEKLLNIIKKTFDLTPQGIIDYLDLKKPIYELTAAYGHFGRDIFSWEKIKELNNV